jgi:hypothetical protein
MGRGVGNDDGEAEGVSLGRTVGKLRSRGVGNDDCKTEGESLGRSVGKLLGVALEMTTVRLRR